MELAKYDSTPLYYYTEKDLLNRVTVLKEQGKEIYLIAGRYTRFENDSRLYNQLTDDEKGQIEKQLRRSGREPRRDLVITARPQAPLQRRADVTQLAEMR